jgi:hypothetical protein
MPRTKGGGFDTELLSLNTVRTHVQKILVKLGVDSKLEAVAFALEHGWTPGPEDPDALALGRLEGSQVVAALPLGPDSPPQAVARPSEVDERRQTTTNAETSTCRSTAVRQQRASS